MPGPGVPGKFFLPGFRDGTSRKYIFELSDEPVKVHPGKIDTKSVFFPKYARGTSPETLKRQAALFQSHSPHEASKSKPAISIHMNDDKTERDVHERSGYEFHHAENQEEIVITTETPDEEVWLNDGDPDSPFSIRPVPPPIRKFVKSPCLPIPGPPGMKRKSTCT